MKVYTTLDTLSEAWGVLESVGLDKLLLGKTNTFDAEKLLNALLKERKLQDFLMVITHRDASEVGSMEITDAAQAVADFFGGITGGLKGLSGLGVQMLSKSKTPQVMAKVADK